MLKLPAAKDDWKQKLEETKLKNKALKSSGKYPQSDEKDFKAENIGLATYVPKYTTSDECMFELFPTEH